MWLAPLTLALASGPWVAVVGVLCDGARHDTRAAGFFVAEDLVVTALHAVTGSESDDVPRSVTVVTADRRRYRVTRVEAIDTARDAALLRVPCRSTSWFRPAPGAFRGERLVVAGSPLRPDRGPLSVELTGPRIDELGDLRYRVDRALRGRSGSPAVDAEGRYVGFVTTTHELVPADVVSRLLAGLAPVSLREAHLAVVRSPQGHLDFARSAYRRGDLQRAKDLLLDAVAVEPRLADAHNLLGVLLRREGRTEEAIAHYELAIRYRPSYGPAFRNLGLLQADLAVGRRVPRQAQTAVAASGPGRVSPSNPVPDRTRTASSVLPAAASSAPFARNPLGPFTASFAFALALGLPALAYLLWRRVRRRA